MIVETSSKLRFAAIDVCVDVASEMSVCSAGLAETHYLVWLKWSQQKLSRKALESNNRIKYACTDIEKYVHGHITDCGTFNFQS